MTIIDPNVVVQARDLLQRMFCGRNLNEPTEAYSCGWMVAFGMGKEKIFLTLAPSEITKRKLGMSVRTVKRGLTHYPDQLVVEITEDYDGLKLVMGTRSMKDSFPVTWVVVNGGKPKIQTLRFEMSAYIGLAHVALQSGVADVMLVHDNQFIYEDDVTVLVVKDKKTGDLVVEYLKQRGIHVEGVLPGMFEATRSYRVHHHLLEPEFFSQEVAA